MFIRSAITVSDAQVTKIVRLANELSEGKVRLMLDCDAEGDDGAKEAAWKLLQTGLDVRPLWSRSMYDGKFAGRQPESQGLPSFPIPSCPTLTTLAKALPHQPK